MPASEYFTVTGGSYTSYNEYFPNYPEGRYIYFQLLGSGDISFKQNLTTYFTVIGGGGGGGGGGLDSGSAGYVVAGGGGGAGASGKISFLTSNNVPYSYEVGPGGNGGGGDNQGSPGNDSSVTFSTTEKIVAIGGDGGNGWANGNGGGDGGTLTIQGVNTIINGTSGNGGHGFRGDGVWGPVPNPSLAFPGTGNNPISIEIYPGISELVGGGGAGGYTYGGGGGNGNGGAVDGGSPAPPYAGVSGIAYGGGGGGGATDSTTSTYGGAGKEGAIFVYILLPPLPQNGCDWNPLLQEQTTIWSRADGDCTDLSGAFLPDGSAMTRADLSEKRKAVIFQYKNNSAGFSKKQQFSRLARGLGKPRGKTYATQGYNVTNPNVQNLPVVGKNVPTVVEDGSGNFVTQDVFMGTTLVCAGANKISGLTTQNDTPGPTRTITNYPTVPLTNYIVRRTYKGGSEKWPQYGPNTGQPRLPKYARNTGTKPGMNFWRPGSS
jgi:hypothetical protein